MTEVAAEKKKADVKAIYNEKFVGNFTRKELDTLRATIARGTTDEEFGLYVQTCVNTGLNPFLNHIHCMVYEGKNGRQMSIQISSEGVLYLARKTKGYKGVDAQMVHENDEFMIDLAKKKIIKHEIGFPRGRIIGAYAIARHTEFEDKILLMDVQEVEHMKKGKNAHMWNTWFADMFKKHILKRVAKEQYGIDLTEDEVQAAPMDRLDVTPEANVIEIDEGHVVKEDEQLTLIWNEIYNNVDRDVIEKCMFTYFEGRQEKDLLLKDVVALKKFCQLETTQKNKQKRKTEFVEEPEFIKKPEQPKAEEDEFSLFFD
ncbi:hypothetical protein COJ96_10745 [Bacillus sp. AFS073361]|uniref:RecT family recombinase n=1 Tax=Bacillus sp. AFS073361 TaxID=2033511 RepID=UPI000BF93527|nr:RecT family recombinase [Bacillus sp. AFS073361]PFP29374.1 hypothetical protein COJ96_10745 [Bacillus sp. AFS073361]